MSFDSTITTEKFDLERELQVTIADREISWTTGEIGANIQLELSHVVRAETDRNYITERIRGASAELVLTAGEIDHLIEKLVLAKSLLGSDFLIYGHTDNYTKDGVDYTKDGVERTE